MSDQAAWFAMDGDTGILHALDESGKPHCLVLLPPGSPIISRATGDTHDCCLECMQELARKTT